jgi:hypothetical protein
MTGGAAAYARHFPFPITAPLPPPPDGFGRCLCAGLTRVPPVAHSP